MPSFSASSSETNMKIPFSFETPTAEERNKGSSTVQNCWKKAAFEWRFTEPFYAFVIERTAGTEKPTSTNNEKSFLLRVTLTSLSSNLSSRFTSHPLHYVAHYVTLTKSIYIFAFNTFFQTQPLPSWCFGNLIWIVLFWNFLSYSHHLSLINNVFNYCCLYSLFCCIISTRRGWWYEMEQTWVEEIGSYEEAHFTFVLKLYLTKEKSENLIHIHNKFSLSFNVNHL